MPLGMHVYMYAYMCLDIWHNYCEVIITRSLVPDEVVSYFLGTLGRPRARPPACCPLARQHANSPPNEGGNSEVDQGGERSRPGSRNESNYFLTSWASDFL